MPCKTLFTLHFLVWRLFRVVFGYLGLIHPYRADIDAVSVYIK